MHLATIFNNLATIDTSRKEYVDFKSAVLDIDWRLSQSIRASASVLTYAPGVVFSNVPLVNQHPIHIKKWGLSNLNRTTPNFQRLWDTSIPMFSYIEELVPNYGIVKAEIMATPPELVSGRPKINRIHIDPLNMHSLSKRCQIALLSNAESYLFVEGIQQHITEGTIYEFDNKRPHWGVNYGNTLKICLVVDMINLDVWNNLSSCDKDKFFDQNITQQEIDHLNNYKRMLLLAPS